MLESRPVPAWVLAGTIMIPAIDWPWPDAEKLPDLAVRVAATLVAAWLAHWILFVLVGRIVGLLERRGRAGPHEAQRASTLGQILRSLVMVIVYGAAAIRVVDILGWDVGPFLAGAGILGVALGFGAQTLVRDVIAGVFVLIEDQYAVGDLVEVNGRAASVERISVRSTVLRDFNGYLYFVPNGAMKIVVNRSRGWNRQAIDVQIPLEENVDQALEVCHRTVEGLNADAHWAPRLLDPIAVWGVEALGGREAQIRIVLRTRPGADGPETARELRRRLQRALAEAGVGMGTSRDIVMHAPGAEAPAKGT